LYFRDGTKTEMDGVSIMPVPRGENQEKSWPSGKWKKTKAQLIKGVVVAD